TEGLVCAAAGVCGAGQACVVARCRPSDAIVTPSDTNRILLQPVDVAVLASGRTDASPPDAIVLGAEASGATVVLLRFEATWRDDAEVTSAFLVFDMVDGAPPARGTTTVEAARILDRWSSETASWGRQPRLTLPETAGVIRATPSGRLRIDV